jgi:peptide/nickel transport system permease protein
MTASLPTRIALGVLLAVALVGGLADALAWVTAPALPNCPPSFAHPLGTNALALDRLALFAFGARSLTGVLAFTVAVTLPLGVILGVLAGAGPRGYAFVLTRFVELTGLWPSVVLLGIALSVGVAPPTFTVAGVVGVLHGLRAAELVRAEALRTLHAPFVLAATALGASRVRVALVHVVPHALPVACASGALAAAHVVALETALGYVGAQAPVSWGALLAEARAPGLVTTCVGLAALAVTLALLLLARGLTDQSSPKRRDRSASPLSTPLASD